jgi:hypothetical protein
MEDVSVRAMMDISKSISNVSPAQRTVQLVILTITVLHARME